MRILCFIVTALLLVLHSADASAKSRTFLCNDGSTVTITVLGNDAIRAVGIREANTLTLRESKTEKWYFLNGDYSVRISPDQSRAEIGIPDWGVDKCVAEGAPRASTPLEDSNLFVRQPDDVALAQKKATEAPTASESSFPHAAQSWGGALRASPNKNSKKLATLKEGDKITILAKSSAAPFQNYPWFKVSYRGRTGYHWGGIICPKGKSIPGTYKVCN